MKAQSVNLAQFAAAQEEMLESLEAQLAALYEEKQHGNADDGEIAMMRETIASLEAQLIGIELPTGVRLTVNASVDPEDLSRMMSILAR